MSIHKHYFLFYFFLLCALISSAQVPTIEWQKTFGGSSDDWAWDIRETPVGDYFVVGETWSVDQDVTSNHGNSDYWILKLDASGNLLWQKTYGGTSEEAAYALSLTGDGGCIVVGYSNSTDGDVTDHHGSSITSDWWVIRIDADGNLLWEKSFGSNDEDQAHAVVKTSDGNYAITGWVGANSGDVTGWHGFLDYWVIVIDADGEPLQKKCLGGSADDKAYGIQTTDKHHFIITGETASTDGDITSTYGNDAWAVLLDSSLNIIHQTCYGGTSYESGRQIHTVDDGGFISIAAVASEDGDVTGHHGNPGGNDYWLVKMDSMLQVVWQKCIGGSGDDLPWSVEKITGDNYIIGGGAFSLDGDKSQHLGSYDNWLVKTDASGNILWEKSAGGFAGDDARMIRETADLGYVVAGYTSSSNGDVTLNHGSLDVWIVKLSPENATGINHGITTTTSFSLYPNPASSDVKVFIALDSGANNYSIAVMDIYGHDLLSYEITGESMPISLQQMGKGIYMIVLKKKWSSGFSKTTISELMHISQSKPPANS